MTNTPNFDKFIDQMNEMLLVGAITNDPKVREFNDVMLGYSFKMAESHWNASHKPNEWYKVLITISHLMGMLIAIGVTMVRV